MTLVISEPYVGQGLNPQLKQFWDQTTYKNRMAFLTGSRNTFDSLVESAKRLKAIQHIIDEMEAEKAIYELKNAGVIDAVIIGKVIEGEGIFVKR